MQIAWANNTFLQVIEYIAVFCCGMVGGSATVRRGYDITAIIIASWLTALGGGILLSGPLGLGLEGIWIAMACDECLRAGLFLWRWHSRTWSRIRLAAAY